MHAREAIVVGAQTAGEGQMDRPGSHLKVVRRVHRRENPSVAGDHVSRTHSVACPAVDGT